MTEQLGPNVIIGPGGVYIRRAFSELPAGDGGSDCDKCPKTIKPSAPGGRQLIELFSWCATCIAIIGVVANNRQLAWCFPVWMLSNAITACVHLRSRLWALAVRDAIFFALAIHGWLSWTRGA